MQETGQIVKKNSHFEPLSYLSSVQNPCDIPIILPNKYTTRYLIGILILVMALCNPHWFRVMMQQLTRDSDHCSLENVCLLQDSACRVENGSKDELFRDGWCPLPFRERLFLVLVRCEWGLLICKRNMMGQNSACRFASLYTSQEACGEWVKNPGFQICVFFSSWWSHQASSFYQKMLQRSVGSRETMLPKNVAFLQDEPQQKCEFTLAETNSSPLKISHRKRKLVFQPSILRCYSILVSGRVIGFDLMIRDWNHPNCEKSCWDVSIMMTFVGDSKTK